MPTFTYASKNLFALIISCFLLMVIGPTAQSQPDLQVEATADPYSTCTQGAVELNAVATGGTGDYDYSWVGNPGNFTSSIQNPTVFPDVSTTTDITYTVVVNDGAYIVQDTAEVTVIANPEADAGADASMCETDNSYFLNGEATDSDYTEWTTAGDGSFGSTGSLQTPYEPGEQDQQNGSVQITLHAFATPPCTGFDSDQMTLTIIPKPTVDAGENQNICENESVQLAGNASDYSQVTWSGGDGDFGDPNSLQTIYTPGENDTSNGYVELTLTADPEEPCTETVTDQLDVDITNLPIAEAGPDDTICEGNTYTPFQANAQYYSTVSWTSDGDGEFENPNSLNPVYNPGSNDIESGEVMLTLTASGEQACDEEVSDAMTLTINYAPEVDAGEDASICESDTYQLQPTVQYSNEVQWSTSGDGTFINDTTENAVYDPGEEDIANDSVELTITAQPIAPCEEPASDEMTLSFEPSPIVSAGENGEVCDNGAYQLDGDTIFSESVYWSSDGEGTFDDSTQINATYFPVEEDGQNNGEVTLTLSATPVSPCSDTIQDSMQLDILPSPFVYAGSDNTICETGTFEPNNADVEDADTYYWSTTGDGNFIDDDTLNTLTPEYIPGEQDIAEDSVYLVLTGENDNCSDNQDSLLLTIQGEPMADAGEDTSKCVPEGVTPQFTLNGSVENSDYYVWSVEGGNSTGSFDSTVNILDPVFTFGPQGMENQSATLTLTANAISPCPTPDSDEVELSFSWQPTVDAGVDTVICEGTDSIQLDGDVSHESTLIWQRIPDTLNSGNFGSQVVEDPVYYPSSADFEAGEIKLMLQAFGAGDCNQIEARDTVIYNVQKLPVADAGEDITICEDEMAEISDAEAQHYGSVQWDALNGSGSFSDENSLTTTYNPSSGDLAKDSIALKLSAWAVDPCEAPDSDTLILSINKNPTIGFEENIYPCTSAPIDLDTIIEVNDYDEISWSSSGDGSFTGSYPEKYYNPGEEDINNEQMTISLTAAPQSGCSESVSDSTLIYLTPGPSIENLEDIREAAFNETITFEPTVTGANPLAYKWMPDSLFNDSLVKNGTIKPIMYNGNGLPDTNLVRFKVTDLANECAAVDTVEVQMELKQPVIEFTNDTTNVCKGSPLELNSLIENIARGSGPEHFDTTWSSPGPTVHPTQDTEYQLTVEDSFADNASKSIDIHVLDSADKPQIKEEESTKNVSEYSRATYEPVNTDTEDAYYEWSALNGSVVQGQGTSEATIEWGMAGQGEVYLKKTTPFGCFGVHDTLKVDIGVDAVQEITTVENLKIYPNPVKDELNITFHLKESKEVEFVLFNSMGGALQQREAPDKMPGQQEYRLDMSRYNSGLYLLKLRVGEESVLKRIIRIK